MAIRLLLTSKDPLILLIRHEPPPHGLKVRTQIVCFIFWIQSTMSTPIRL